MVLAIDIMDGYGFSNKANRKRLLKETTVMLS